MRVYRYFKIYPSYNIRGIYSLGTKNQKDKKYHVEQMNNTFAN